MIGSAEEVCSARPNSAAPASNRARGFIKWFSQISIDDIPFGGIGESGMGHYHGYEGFLTFTKAKGVFRKGRFNATRNILPPFGGAMHKFIYKFLLK